MTQTIQERRDALVASLTNIKDKDERLRYIVEQAKSLEKMPDQVKMDHFLVQGCISRAWLVPSQKEGKITFMADSEALIVKGIIAILLKVYNGSTSDEIIQNPPDFLAEVGITEHLSLNRRNGLSNIVKLINHYAEVFKKS